MSFFSPDMYERERLFPKSGGASKRIMETQQQEQMETPDNQQKRILAAIFWPSFFTFLPTQPRQTFDLM